MYLGEYEIDDYLDLVATTHQFSTGAAYAPSAITYRVYENGSATEMISDTGMTNFDTVTGFYYDRIQLTTALGYEAGKSYVALIQATVDSVAAISWRSWKVIAAPITAVSIADQVWDELLAGHTVSDSTGEALSTAASVLGAGATTFTYTLTDADSGDPIADADVWVSSNLAGTDIIASGRTDSSGQITFYLDLGTTAYIFRQKSGYDFTNPDTETV